MSSNLYDLAIVGGGINGAGIAADAAGRGLKVVLLEQGDLAQGTSSASSKLIHGGLRYLEHYEFRLVREALAEREVLLAKAPHIIRPLRFVVPLVAGMRPAWMIRAGLFLYDHLAPRALIPGSASVDLTCDSAGQELRPDLTRGFAYWDCWVDDARLVVLNAMAAAERGAKVRTRACVVRAAVSDGLWRLELLGGGGDVNARALVNATGPWVGEFSNMLEGAAGRHLAPRAERLRLVKGSHIVVPRRRGAEDAYLMQSADGRVVFALPFEDRFTLIGTTDVPFVGDPAKVAIDADEERYLLALASRFFRDPPTQADIVWRYAGVRPLQDDEAENPSAVSRDYRLALDTAAGAPVLHVIGGKVTTYRKLAEAALAALAPHLPPMGPAWTAGAPLPGGDLGPGGARGYLDALSRRRPKLDRALLSKLAARYGTRVELVLGSASTLGDLGEDMGAGLSAREVDYLMANEWARTPDDVLWRRTKLGLGLADSERDALQRRLVAHMNTHV